MWAVDSEKERIKRVENLSVDDAIMDDEEMISILSSTKEYLHNGRFSTETTHHEHKQEEEQEKEKEKKETTSAEGGEREASENEGLKKGFGRWMLHGKGECSPCSYFHRPNGCEKGNDCTFCHICDNEKLRRKIANKSKRWKKSKEALKARPSVPPRGQYTMSEQSTLVSVERCPLTAPFSQAASSTEILQGAFFPWKLNIPIMEEEVWRRTGHTTQEEGWGTEQSQHSNLYGYGVMSL